MEVYEQKLLQSQMEFENDDAYNAYNPVLRPGLIFHCQQRKEANVFPPMFET